MICRKRIVFPTAILILIQINCTYRNDSPVLKGPYLGQKPPGMTPEIFAPGIVSTEKIEHSPAIFSKEGKDLFWSYYDKGEHVIMVMQEVKGAWTTPEKSELMPEIFNASNVNWTPYVSPDENYIIFSSDRRGIGDGYNACDLYISFNNPESGWIDPVNMGHAINTDQIERFPWVSPDEKYLFFVRGFGDIFWVDAKTIEELKPDELK